MLQAEPAASQRRGVIPHAPLLKMVLPNTANQEVAVYEAEHEPGGINPRHLHPAAIGCADITRRRYHRTYLLPLCPGWPAPPICPGLI